MQTTQSFRRTTRSGSRAAGTTRSRWLRRVVAILVLVAMEAAAGGRPAETGRDRVADDRVSVSLETFQIPERIPNRPAARAESVPGSIGILERRNRKIDVFLRTYDLPNGAYTLWFHLSHDDGEVSVLWAGNSIVDDGTLSLNTTLKEGEKHAPGFIFVGHGLQPGAAATVGVQVFVRYHGPAFLEDPERLELQLTTPFGSCADPLNALPLPGDYPCWNPQRAVFPSVSPGDGEADVARGRMLFDTAPMDGNGTACLHCHPTDTGTLNPERIQALGGEGILFQNDRRDFIGTTRGITTETFDAFETHATVMVDIDLPDNVVVDGDPSVRTVFFRRGIPSNINVGAQDDVVLSDGRAPNLEAMAVEATEVHAEASLSGLEVIDRMVFIPIFERGDVERSFSSPAIREFVMNGTAPPRPGGRGASFFEPGGACAACHGGPMLNTREDGERFANNGVSARNRLGNEVNAYAFDGGPVLHSSDPGRALSTGRAADFEAFKIPSLFNVRNTAPYFHDASAKTLEEAVRHYDAAGIVSLSDSDVTDLLDFLERLD